ncbi:hypothetical protein [Bradyrhizobium sp. SZCCHNRI20481]|uniref:hypothetical protein n=1 Tax=Bradyrhizobium sp. SZCCHNRI20481 TaxID=3057286 RepID=UPI002916E496|nr:hypothetical protein [Bradyrhizobium sp. SZCCHNRI20481]
MPRRSSFVSSGIPVRQRLAQPVKPNGSTKDEINEKKPASHAVYVVEGENDIAFWTKIGAAWEHQDGKGFNIQLSCLP